MAKYAQNGLGMHLLQSRISKFSGGRPLRISLLQEELKNVLIYNYQLGRTVLDT
jgi:hypothetical protein